MSSIDFPPGAGKKMKEKAEKPMPANFETLDSAPPDQIVMVNSILTRQAEGKKPRTARKPRKSVSEGGTVYRAKEFESIGGAPVQEDEIPTHAEYGTQLREGVRSIGEIEDAIKAKRAEVAALERAARATGGIRETERFQTHDGGVAAESVEAQIVKAENEIRTLEQEKRSAGPSIPIAANDNMPRSAALPPVEVPPAARVEQNLTLPASRAVREAAQKKSPLRNGMLAALAVFGVGVASPTAAGQKAEHKGAAKPAATRTIEAPRMPHAIGKEAVMPPIVVPVAKGEGADKVFANLQAMLTATYHTAEHAPNPVVKKVMETSPNTLSRTFKFAQGPKSTMSLQPGDAFSISTKGELVYRSGAKERVLYTAEAKVPGTFSWGHMRITVPFLGARAEHAPSRHAKAGAAPEAPVSASQKFMYAEELLAPAAQGKRGGFSKDTSMEKLLQDARRASVTGEIAPAPAPAPTPAAHAEAPAVTVPAPKPEAPAVAVPAPAAPAPEAPRPAPNAQPETPHAAPALPAETFTNAHGVEIHPSAAAIYRDGNKHWVVWGGDFQARLDTARDAIAKARAKRMRLEVYVERERMDAATGAAETTMYLLTSQLLEEHVYPPQDLPFKPFGPDDFVKPDERSAQELHGILGGTSS